MATTLGLFKDAYATMTVATYEPLILKWLSQSAVYNTSSELANRYIDDGLIDAKLDTPTYLQSFDIQEEIKNQIRNTRGPIDPLINLGNNLAPTDLIGGKFEFSDVKLNFHDNISGIKTSSGIFTEPLLTKSPSNYIDPKPNFFNFIKNENKVTQQNIALGINKLRVSASASVLIYKSPNENVKSKIRKIHSNLVKSFKDSTKNNKNVSEEVRKELGKNVVNFFPIYNLEEALSPIGICHFYRQLYFNSSEGLGPIEQAFTVAPKETLEVVTQNYSKVTQEELLEENFESESSNSIETKQEKETSEKVHQALQKNTAIAMSANVSGGVGVWDISAGASTNLSASQTSSRDIAVRNLKEVTNKSSETVRQSTKIRVSSREEYFEGTTTTHTIKNDSDTPVNYGLRRVLRKVRVKIQDLGPQLVWQIYIKNPGMGLVKSKYMFFDTPDEVLKPGIPPGVPEPPKGGTESGSQQVSIDFSFPSTTEDSTGSDGNNLIENSISGSFFVLQITPLPGRKVTSVNIDSISASEPGKDGDQFAARISESVRIWDEVKNTYILAVPVVKGDGNVVQVNYTYAYEPSKESIDEWNEIREAAVEYAKNNLATQNLMDDFYEKKELINNIRSIKSRPSNDLRKEERYEVLNRMISRVFSSSTGAVVPSPLEIEYFYKYFDVNILFTFLHPNWWVPRYPVSKEGGRAFDFDRKSYDITESSSAAPMGSSLGWAIQLDGDQRRNEFLNSAWVRVCIPIKKGREKECITWLAKHIEGEVGYDIESGPLSDLLNDIASLREKESSLGVEGPEYIRVGDTGVAAPSAPHNSENVYPVINEFDVTEPTEGFIYDKIETDIN